MLRIYIDRKARVAQWQADKGLDLVVDLVFRGVLASTLMDSVGAEVVAEAAWKAANCEREAVRAAA